MPSSVHHPEEQTSNAGRELAARFEPRALRTYTPSQAVLARSAGIFHWTPEGRKLFDFTSGVLVANLGHNPSRWMKRFVDYMGWSGEPWASTNSRDFFSALALTAYNAVTEVETQASKRLIELLENRPGGRR